jgi:hypothetical protein
MLVLFGVLFSIGFDLLFTRDSSFLSLDVRIFYLFPRATDSNVLSLDDAGVLRVASAVLWRTLSCCRWRVQIGCI